MSVGLAACIGTARVWDDRAVAVPFSSLGVELTQRRHIDLLRVTTAAC